MHYVCIENNTVVGILNYEPNVPSSVIVVQITDQQSQQIAQGTHYFNIDSRTIVSVPLEVITQKQQDTANAVEREFLNSTDWKVLRHIRQKALGAPTSLTDAEYLEIEQQRQAAAARIV
jgi:hypothetical protein